MNWSQVFNPFSTIINILYLFEVSQDWFSGTEQVFVTVFLAFSPLLGTSIGQAITPALVSTPDDIPKMNWLWPIFSTLTMIMFIFLVRSSHPPTPPSKSAEIGQDKQPYLTR